MSAIAVSVEVTQRAMIRRKRVLVQRYERNYGLSWEMPEPACPDPAEVACKEPVEVAERIAHKDSEP